eukprot:GHVN01048283.1.p1 GENE.GHVN01048283.1~~GHVN01048283.1.p1  ORF type:complete len:114 (+),score=32.54 GHVN01048283.1:123-464(+)
MWLIEMNLRNYAMSERVSEFDVREAPVSEFGMSEVVMRAFNVKAERRNSTGMVSVYRYVPVLLVILVSPHTSGGGIVWYQFNFIPVCCVDVLVFCLVFYVMFCRCILVVFLFL